MTDSQRKLKAWNEGLEAAGRGESEADCPYNQTAVKLERDWWLLGHGYAPFIS